jgi:hypothetical protein
MNRRQMIAALGGAVVEWPLAARAAAGCDAGDRISSYGEAYDSASHTPAG